MKLPDIIPIKWSSSLPPSCSTRTILAPLPHTPEFSRFTNTGGKKPYEPLAYLIERLTDEGDIVLDPFMGSGVSGFAANQLHRKFIGIDLNPVAHKLSSLVLEPPSRRLLQQSLKHLELSPSQRFKKPIKPAQVNHPFRICCGMRTS